MLLPTIYRYVICSKTDLLNVINGKAGTMFIHYCNERQSIMLLNLNLLLTRNLTQI